MSVLTGFREQVTVRSRPPTEPQVERATSSRALRIVAAVTRLGLGWIFIWAFFDKLLGLGHETVSKDAWINGGHPTEGFLKFAASGPFKGFYNDIAGAAWADWLFMAGLIGIGLALALGITMRLTVSAGVLLLVLMWSAVLPPANNVFMDDHLIYAGTLVILLLLKAGHTFGFGKWWERLPLVQRFPFLR
jgi:thiosulfate dehydrogenase (quinone) large subunit